MTRRTVHRKDLNQDEIVSALRKIGCTVYIIGRPVDLVVGYRARNYLIDVKRKGQSDKGKTDFQREFFNTWRGQVRTVETVDDAIEVVTKSYGGGHK